MRKRHKKAMARDRFWVKLATLANYVIAQHGPGGIEEIKLWWIIWRADMEAYRQWRVSITRARWRKGRECPEPEFHWPTWRENERRRGCDGRCPIPVRDGKDLTTSNQENP